jgi:hypothetical protein
VHAGRWAGLVVTGQPGLTKDPNERDERTTHSTQHSTRHWRLQISNGLNRGSPYLSPRVESRMGTDVHMIPAVLLLFLNSHHGIPMQFAQLSLVTVTHRPALRHGVSANCLAPVVAKTGHVL